MRQRRLHGRTLSRQPKLHVEHIQGPRFSRDPWKALLKTPVGLLGLLSLSAQLVVSFWVVVSYPDDFGSRVWSNPVHWVDNPKAAPPSWIRRVDSRPRADYWQASRREPEWLRRQGAT